MSADVGFVVYYQPRFPFSMRQKKLFRMVLIENFQKERLWQHQPSDNEFRRAWDATEQKLRQMWLKNKQREEFLRSLPKREPH